jgi:hypothetical protein
MALIGRVGWFVGHRPVAIVVLAEPLPFVSRDVAERLAPVVKLIAECAVSLLVARKDAGQAHHVGDVTAYVDGLFYFVTHDFLFMGLLLKSEELKPVPATLSLKPFFVGHITGDGCAPYYFAPLFKAAVRVELKATLRTFLFKCLCHRSVLLLIHFLWVSQFLVNRACEADAEHLCEVFDI